jgi:hypothetical protein
MPQEKFDQDNGLNTPKKILDAGPNGAYVAIQVLDASTLYIDNMRDHLAIGGLGAALNLVQGFQIKAAAGIVFMWWKGEMWGRSDTNGGIINQQIIFKLKGKDSFGALVSDQPPALADDQL